MRGVQEECEMRRNVRGEQEEREDRRSAGGTWEKEEEESEMSVRAGGARGESYRRRSARRA